MIKCHGKKKKRKTQCSPKAYIDNQLIVTQNGTEKDRSVSPE